MVQVQPLAMASAEDAASAAQEMSDKFLHCRDVRHDWPRKPSRITALKSGYERVWKCGCCGTVRTEVITRFGHLVSADYDYPDGYLLSGLGRMGTDARAALRLEAITRSKSDWQRDNSWGVEDEGVVVDLRDKRRAPAEPKVTGRARVAARG